MKIKLIITALFAVIVALAAFVAYSECPVQLECPIQSECPVAQEGHAECIIDQTQEGEIEYGQRKTAQDLPHELFVDTYLKRNTIKAGGIMEIIVRIPEVSIYDEKHKSYGRVMVRYAYPSERLENPTSYAYDFYYDGTTRFNYENENISIEKLKDNYNLVKFAVPGIPGPYNVEVNDPIQKYEITVVSQMDTRERLLEMLQQYFYTQYNLINQRPIEIEIKEFIVGEEFLEVTHYTSYKVCRSTSGFGMAKECAWKHIAGKLFIEPDTGVVRRDDSIFPEDDFEELDWLPEKEFDS